MTASNRYLFFSTSDKFPAKLEATVYAWDIMQAFRLARRWPYDQDREPTKEEIQKCRDWYGLDNISAMAAGNGDDGFGDFVLVQSPGGRIIETYGFISPELPDESWRKRQSGQIKITDLGLGAEGSYSDYEEMAFSDVDVKVYTMVREAVADMVYSSAYSPYRSQEGPDLYATNGMDPEEFCDVVFYNVAHMMMWWTANTQNIMTEDMVRLAVETSWYMLNSTLNTGWLSRSGFSWAEEYEKVKGKKRQILPDDVPDTITAYWYEPGDAQYSTDEVELTYTLQERKVIKTYNDDDEEENSNA